MSTPPPRGLDELERRLRELERQLLGTPDEPSLPPPPPPEPRSTWSEPPPAPPAPARPVAAPPATPAAPTTGQLVADARHELGGLQEHLDELVRFRQRLEASARELLEDYERLLERIGEADQAPERDHASPDGPVHLDGPVAGRGSWSATPGTPAHTRLDGAVTVDAGPFADIATLSSFEQALGHIAEVGDVYVRGFAGDRAQIDVVLDGPVALGEAIERVSPVACRAVAADATTLTVTLGAS